MFRYIDMPKLVAYYLREFSYRRDGTTSTLYQFVFSLCLPFVSKQFRSARLAALAIAECTNSKDQIKRLFDKLMGGDATLTILSHNNDFLLSWDGTGAQPLFPFSYDMKYWPSLASLGLSSGNQFANNYSNRTVATYNIPAANGFSAPYEKLAFLKGVTKSLSLFSKWIHYVNNNTDHKLLPNSDYYCTFEYTSPVDLTWSDTTLPATSTPKRMTVLCKNTASLTGPNVPNGEFCFCTLGFQVAYTDDPQVPYSPSPNLVDLTVTIPSVYDDAKFESVKQTAAAYLQLLIPFYIQTNINYKKA